MDKNKLFLCETVMALPEFQQFVNKTSISKHEFKERMKEFCALTYFLSKYFFENNKEKTFYTTANSIFERTSVLYNTDNFIQNYSTIYLIRKSNFLQKYVYVSKKGFFFDSKNARSTQIGVTDAFLELIKKMSLQEYIELDGQQILNTHLACVLETKHEYDTVGIVRTNRYTAIQDYYYKHRSEYGMCIKQFMKQHASSVVVKERTYKVGSFHQELTNNIKSKNLIDFICSYDTHCSHSTQINNERLKEAMSITDIDNKTSENLNKLSHFVSKNGNIIIPYHRSSHGRLYSHIPLQFVPKVIRNYILSGYEEVDISASAYSILYNFAVSRGYSKKKIEEIGKLVKDPTSYRKSILNELKVHDKNLQYEYIKTALTSIVYGCNTSTDHIAYSIIGNHKQNLSLCNIEGYTVSSIPVEFCQNEHIKAIKEEIKNLIKWYISNNTVIENDKKYLINEHGQKMLLDKQSTKGKKIAHIYQGLESSVLETISRVTIDDTELLEKGIGLLLHDGIYIDKKITSVYNIKKLFNAKLHEKYGFTLNFS